MQYQIRTVEIFDKPRFPVRGIMIDSSRHFLSVNVIKRQLEIMSMNKLNVLHWHLVDSESFPYTSVKFPELHGVVSRYYWILFTFSNLGSLLSSPRLLPWRYCRRYCLCKASGNSCYSWIRFTRTYIFLERQKGILNGMFWREGCRDFFAQFGRSHEWSQFWFYFRKWKL